MWHSGIRVIQDPVHGLMEFMSSESLILDLLRSSELQRLRRTKPALHNKLTTCYTGTIV